MISVLLLIVGYWLVGAAWRYEHRFESLLGLVALLNVYEIGLIGTAAYLKRRKPGHPHRGFLVGLEALLMVDPTLMTESLAASSPSMAWPVLAVMAAAAAWKLALLDWLVVKRFDAWRLAWQAAMILAVYQIPAWSAWGAHRSFA